MNKDNEKKIDNLFNQLRQGLKDLYKDSKKYLDFLQINSNWKIYSINNQVLLWIQCCKRGFEGKYLNTFYGWKKLGYSVNKGEKAIEILMPGFQKYFKNKEDKWISVKNANEEQLNKIKNNEFEVKEAVTTFFLKKAIFDISQTNCPREEYESKILEKVIPKSLEESQDEKIDFLFLNLKKHIVEVEQLPVIEKKLKEELKGYVTEDEIVLNEDNSNLQNLKTLIHEYTHYKLHINNEQQLNRYQKEIEAESVAYIVCSSYDIDTSDYSFKYINMYGQERTEEELYNSFENITFTANSIKAVLDTALSLEMLNYLNAGDIVYANLEYSDTNEQAQRLLFLINNKGDQYEAFNITSEEKPYITSVKLAKDDNNNLKEDSIIKMNVKYLVNRKDIVKKIGTVIPEELTKIKAYAELFESKNMIKEFKSNPVISKPITMNTGMDFSLNLKK